MDSPSPSPTLQALALAVRGALTLTVKDVPDAQTDAMVRTALARTIGKSVGIEPTRVRIDSMVPDRRLATELSLPTHRRLEQALRVEFTILASSEQEANTAVNKLANMEPVEFNEKLATEMALGGSTKLIQVVEVQASRWEEADEPDEPDERDEPDEVGPPENVAVPDEGVNLLIVAVPMAAFGCVVVVVCALLCYFLRVGRSVEVEAIDGDAPDLGGGRPRKTAEALEDGTADIAASGNGDLRAPRRIEDAPQPQSNAVMANSNGIAKPPSRRNVVGYGSRAAAPTPFDAPWATSRASNHRVRGTIQGATSTSPPPVKTQTRPRTIVADNDDYVSGASQSEATTGAPRGLRSDANSAAPRRFSSDPDLAALRGSSRAASVTAPKSGSNSAREPFDPTRWGSGDGRSANGGRAANAASAQSGSSRRGDDNDRGAAGRNRQDMGRARSASTSAPRGGSVPRPHRGGATSTPHFR